MEAIGWMDGWVSSKSHCPEGYSQKGIWCSWLISSIHHYDLWRDAVIDVTQCYLLAQMTAYVLGSSLPQQPRRKIITYVCLNHLRQVQSPVVTKTVSPKIKNFLSFPVSYYQYELNHNQLVWHLSSPSPQKGGIFSEHTYESFCHILNTSSLLNFNYTVLWQMHYKNNYCQIYLLKWKLSRGYHFCSVSPMHAWQTAKQNVCTGWFLRYVLFLKSLPVLTGLCVTDICQSHWFRITYHLPCKAMASTF